MGGFSYIDRSEERPCLLTCPCLRLDHQNEENRFAFKIRKTTSSIDVELSSGTLSSCVSRLLGSVSQVPGSNKIKGFLLLKHASLLKTQLQKLRNEMRSEMSVLGPWADVSHHEQRTQLKAELGLLVEGFIGDHQVFESFGYENLYEKAFLTYDRWKAFQSSKASLTLDWLDGAFHEIDQYEDNAHPKNVVRVNLVEPLLASSPMLSLAARDGSKQDVKWLLDRGHNPSELHTGSIYDSSPPLIEAIKNGHHQIVKLLIDHGANVDGVSLEGHLEKNNSPLIAAIYKSRSDIITQLLDHGASPFILSHITKEDRWLFARSLIDDGVDANALLNTAFDLDSVESRLLYVLLDGGADIQSARTNSLHGSLGQNLNLSDSEIKKLELLRVHNAHMISAIGRGDSRCVKAQISCGADPTFGIDAALVNGESDTLRLLLQKGADPRYLAFGKPQACLQPAMITDACLRAVAEGCTAITQFILYSRESADSIGGEIGKAFLTSLIRRCRERILRMLLKKGVP